MIRPPAVRAAALVFGLGLLEPGAPLILELRRTLAYQIVEAASRPVPFPGVAAWCLLAGVIALLGAAGLHRLSGKPIITNSIQNDLAPNRRRPRRAPLARAAGSVAILTVWCLWAWLPVLGLARLAFLANDAQSGSDGGRSGLLARVASRFDRPPVRRIAIDSALVGLEVTGAILALFWLAQSGRRARGAAPAIDAMGPRLPVVVLPPLVVGVGVLAIPEIAVVAASWLPTSAPGAAIARAFTTFAEWISPSATHSNFLAVSIAWVLGPLFFSCWHSPRQDPSAAPSTMDAARLASASRLRALWLGAPNLALIWFGRCLAAWALAATNLTPALLASPGTDGPTLAPGFLILAEGLRDARSLAAGLALLILALHVAALAMAWACGALPRLDLGEPPSA